MRVTRYLWINNLPSRATEQDIRDVLQSHGKIQSVRIHADDGNYGAVVAFVDTKSASRAIESVVKLKKVQLSLQYCESSGNPGNNSLDQLSTSLESVQTCNNASLSQYEDNCPTHKGRSVSMISDSGSLSLDSDKKKSHNRTPRTSEKEMDLNMDAASPRYSNEHRGLKISHLPLRSSDTNLREGLFHEYKKHGKITSVIIRGQDEDRICIITFRRSEDAEKALVSSQGKVFFGTPISVAPHEGLEVEDPDLCPPEHALDEYHPKATKTLFVGNLCSSTITQDELRRTFRVYGEIIYGDIKSVVRALHDQESIRVNGKPVKLGFGKSQPTNVVWLDNLASTINEAYLSRQFGRYGHLTHVILDRKSLRALLYFDAVEMAQRALNETRNRAIIGRKVQIDYAGYECQVAFMRKLTNYEKIGQVYENYKEHLQEFLALWPSYSSVLPILNDRPRYFNESHRDGANFPNENPKFSHKKFSGFRYTSPERSQKQDNSKAKLSGSPRRVHQSVPSSDRRRTFTVDPLEESRCSPQPLGWSSSNCSRSTGKLMDIMDQSIGEELRAGSIFHRKRQQKLSPGDMDTSPHKSSLRRTSHSESRSKHCDIARSRSHLLEETDDISSGSFSSGFTADESPVDDSPSKRSSGSAEGTDPESKTSTRSHRVHSSARSRKRSSESNRLANKSSIRHDTVHLDDAHSASKKHYKYKNSSSPSVSARTSHSSVGRSQKSASRSHMNSLHNHHNRGKPEESVDQRLMKVRSHGHKATCSRSVFDDGDSDTQLAKDKHARSTDVDYTTGKQSMSNSSPSENSFKRNEDIYPTNRMCDSATVSTLTISNVGIKSHDTLTKLELERAKLLRELSLLNDEVIGSGKNKPSTSSLHSEARIGQKRPSCATASELPSPKIKRFEPTTKIDDQLRSPAAISNRTPVLSPTGIEKLSNSNEFRMSRVSTPLSFIASPHPPPHTSVTNQHGYFNTAHCSSGSGHNDPDSPLIANHITSPYARFMGHTNNKSFPVSTKILPVDSIHTPTQGCHQQALMASSPRLIVPPEPTSPLSNISPPHSPNLASSSCVSTSSKLNSVNYNLNQNTFSGNRDPRLALHNQNVCDIPPPPPEAFKLPLWVDTSARQDTSPPANFHATRMYKSNVLEHSKSELSSLHCETESETSLIQDTSVCSLDERIRLLDVQLMKSEKARPVVDYSKFRIRRKVESTTSTQSSTLVTNMNPCVSVAVSSSYSPHLTVSSYMGSRNEFTSPDSANLSVNLAPSINNLITNSAPGGSVLPVSTNLPLAKPADTSEFVKSMLSSTKSPSTVSAEAVSNSGVDQVGISSRLLSPSPSTIDPFVNRLPRESVLKSTPSVGIVTPAPSTFGCRSTTNIVGRLHMSSNNMEYNSLSGAQPVGVATRLLQSQPPSSSDLEKPSVAPVNSSTFKPILKKESTELSELSCTKSSDTTYKPSPPLDYQKPDILHSVMDRKTQRSRSPDECSNGHTMARTNSKYGSATSRSNTLSTSHDISNRTKPKQADSMKNVSSTSSSLPKPIKRAALDHCVFEPWKPVITKGDRVRKPIPTDGKQISSDNSVQSQPTQIKVTPKVQTKLQKKNSKKKTLDQDTERGGNLKQKSSDCLKLSKPVAESNVRARDKAIRKSPPKKKKRIDVRKKVSDSEESDWEASLNDDLPDTKSEPMGTDSSGEYRYESMYDKIKRRTSKNTSKNDPKSKPDSMMQLVKSRNKQSKNLCKKIIRKSPIDSDTDECLSEDSVYPEKSVIKTVSPDSSPKSCRQKVHSKNAIHQPPTSPLKRKKQNAFSSLHSTSSTDLNNNTKKKKSKRPMESDVSMLSSNQARRTSKSTIPISTKEENTKIAGRRRKTMKSSSTVRIHPNGKQTVSSNSNESLQSGSSSFKKRQNCPSAFLNNNSKPSSNAHRNLVHRVFASTDSSSLSSSVCSDASDDEQFGSNKSSGKSVRGSTTTTQNDRSARSKSPSSTPCISRSCSPEDLGADAAVRHTFGAFATPFKTITSEPKPETTYTVPQSDSIEQKGDENQSPGQTTDDSKRTPPTLPMTDSSLSTDHHSCIGLSGKFSSRDPAEWNIFTSLAKQSTPKRDEHRLKSDEVSSSSVSDPLKSNAIQSSNCECENTGKLPSDIDDDLPSLEKHDDDEINKSDGCSILLNESSNLSHNLNEYVDDDLPPPVVPAIDPPLCFTEGPTETGVESDSVIIEEVVYDSLEVPVSDTDVNVSVINPKVAFSLPTTKASDVISDDTQLSGKSESVVESPPHEVVSETHQNLSSLKCESPSETSIKETSASSVAALSLHSTVLTPLAMLTTSTDLPKTGQPIIVTIPGSATTGPYNPSNIALISKLDCPTSQSCSGSSQVSTSAPQRHITFILPAPKVPFSAPPPSPVNIVSSASAVTTTSELKDALPVVCVSSTTSCSIGQAMTPHHTPTSTQTVFSTAVRQLSGISTQSDLPCATTQPISPSPVQSLSSTPAFDQSDIASYVQRVIERVKQEKDEETLHQREKTKRTKKNSTVSACFVSTSASLSSHAPVTSVLGSNISSCITPLPLIAPLPSTATNTCSKQTLQPHIKVDNSTATMGTSNDVTAGIKVAVGPHPTEVKLLSTENIFVGRSFDSHSEPHSSSLINFSLTPSERVDKDGIHNDNVETNMVFDDCGSKDSVDEIIDAVLSGHFDEKEYTQKLLKGTFLNSNIRGSNFGSPPLVQQPDCSVPDQLNNNTDQFQLGDPNVSLAQSFSSQHAPELHTPLGTTVKNTTDYLPTSSPSGVLTPMHVLTFVATCVAPPTSQVLCNPTIVSSTMSNQTTCSISSQSIVSTGSVPSSSSNLPDHAVERTPVGYAPTSDAGDTISAPVSSCSRMEHLAHLASNSLTYIYSFLAQRRLSPSISPSIVSADPATSRTPENLTLPLCVPAKVQGSMKGLSLPDVSLGTSTADYLATMAAMAAMATPSMGTTGNEETLNFNQTNCTSSFAEARQALKEFSWNDHLLTQDHPTIWYGRLSLKNEDVTVRMHYINGNQDVLKSCMSVIAEQQASLGQGISDTNYNACLNTDFSLSHPLKIVQRMRLEPSQLEGVQRKLRQVNDFCMCLTVAAAPPLTSEAALISEQARMSKILCDGFIKYMQDKCAAGIINVSHPCTQQNLFVIHIFPPCEFSRCQLQNCAPGLFHNLTQSAIPYVLTVITTV